MRILKRVVFIFLGISVFMATACKKTVTCNGVPNVGVYFQVDLNNASYNPISYTGGAMEVTGGNNGIVIYHYTASQFQAYDCTCPYDGASNSKAYVQIQSNKIMATCAVCGSSFLLSDGSVNHGPATCPLKAYKASYDGASTVTVSN